MHSRKWRLSVHVHERPTKRSNNIKSRGAERRHRLVLVLWRGESESESKRISLAPPCLFPRFVHRKLGGLCRAWNAGSLAPCSTWQARYDYKDLEIPTGKNPHSLSLTHIHTQWARACNGGEPTMQNLSHVPGSEASGQQNYAYLSSETERTTRTCPCWWLPRTHTCRYWWGARERRTPNLGWNGIWSLRPATSRQIVWAGTQR